MEPPLQKSPVYKDRLCDYSVQRVYRSPHNDLAGTEIACELNRLGYNRVLA